MIATWTSCFIISSGQEQSSPLMEALADMEVAFQGTFLELQQNKSLAKACGLERQNLQHQWEVEKVAMEEAWKIEKADPSTGMSSHPSSCSQRSFLLFSYSAVVWKTTSFLWG